MKKIVAVHVCFLLLVPLVLAQNSVVVPLFFRDGVHIVPCKVNDVPLELVLDTGASAICISERIADAMIEEGALSDVDILGWSRAQVADGRVVDCRVVLFREVEIGGLHIYNVDGLIMDGPNSNLLLGQTVLRRLGPYSIVGNQLIIQKSAEPENDGTSDYLLESAENCLAAGNYLGMIAPLEEMQMLAIISPYGMSKLVQAYSKIQQYDKCIASFRTWKFQFEDETDPIDICDTYLAVADSYINGYHDSEIALDCLSSARASLLQSGLYYLDVADRIADYHAILGQCYEYKQKERDALTAYEQAIEHRMNYLELDVMDIYEGNGQDDFLAEYFYRAACLCPEDSKEFAVYICSAQKAGNSVAKTYLDNYDGFDRLKNFYRAWIEQHCAQK